MSTSKTTSTKKRSINPWQTEILVGHTVAVPNIRVDVSLATRIDNKTGQVEKYISVSKYRRQINGSYNFYKGIGIPFDSAQQLSIIMQRAFDEGKKMGW